MKQIQYAIVALISIGCFFYNSGIQADILHTPVSFGKTHFILGYLPEQHTVIKPSLQEEYKAVYFSPDDNPREVFLSLIRAEKEAIKIAIYMFTDSLIAQELIAAHKRGVRVEVITDPSCLKESSNKIGMLCDAGIDIFVYSSTATAKAYASIMHNKFAIFTKNKSEKALLWTGSFNFTKAASVNNQENVIVLDDEHFIKRFAQQFNQLKGRTYAYQALEVPHKQKTIVAYNNNKENKKRSRKKRYVGSLS
jgi:phosphatidylserine/phosphatidylglycerophosphate/cardiolipin synthase-like enzyme